MQRDGFLVRVYGRCLLVVVVVLLLMLLIVMLITLFGRARVVVTVVEVIRRILERLLQPGPSVGWQRQISWP